MCDTEGKPITNNSALRLIGGNKGGGRGGGIKGSHFRADHLFPLLDGNPTNRDKQVKMIKEEQRRCQYHSAEQKPPTVVSLRRKVKKTNVSQNQPEYHVWTVVNIKYTTLRIQRVVVPKSEEKCFNTTISPVRLSLETEDVHLKCGTFSYLLVVREEAAGWRPLSRAVQTRTS